MFRSLASSLLLVGILLQPVALHAVEQVGSFEWTGVERLVVIGDVHGSYEKLLPLLRGTGLVDEELTWVGGESHVAFLGDLIDRGPLERPVLDLLRQLENEATAAGGRVHVLLGNHEVLNLVGDLRFVEGQGFSDFIDEEDPGDRSAASARFRSMALDAGMPSAKMQAAFYERHPPGFFGRLRAFSPEGEYGKWLLEKPTVVKINGFVFLHGGLTDEVAVLGLEGINQGVRKSVLDFLGNRQLVADGELLTYDEVQRVAEPLAGNRSVRRRTPEVADAADALVEHYDGLAFSEEGPVWYRGNSVENEQIERADLERVLDLLDARGIMVAHTPTGSGRINSRFNGRVVRTDVGMAYGRAPLCLIMQNERLLIFDPRREEGYLSLTIEPTQGERWSDIQEQLPDAQLERFLERAKVLDRILVEREGREGEVWSLKHRKLELRAVFQGVDEPVATEPEAAARRYVHEVATYELDRLMGLRLVPVTVERELDGRKGSLQVWIQNAIDADQIQSAGAERLLEGLEGELMRARIFNALIGGVERADFGKMLLPRERRIMLADNTKAFPLSNDVEELLPEGCSVSPDLELGMRRLDQASLQSTVGHWISAAQIDALLTRRDRILAACSG